MCVCVCPAALETEQCFNHEATQSRGILQIDKTAEGFWLNLEDCGSDAIRQFDREMFFYPLPHNVCVRRLSVASYADLYWKEEDLISPLLNQLTHLQDHRCARIIIVLSDNAETLRLFQFSLASDIYGRRKSDFSFKLRLYNSDYLWLWLSAQSSLNNSVISV